MLGVFMQHRTLAAFVALTMLLVSTSGCLGLLQGREYMESLRDEPEEKLDFSALTIEHVFTNFQQEEWDEDFPIDSSVTEISVYFTTSFVGDDVVPDDWDARYVNVTVYDPNGKVEWSKERTEGGTNLQENIEPQENGKFLSGDWNVKIRAIGAGFSAADTSDDFLVTITVTRTCLEFPPDYSECIIL